ncbi:MAG: TIGR04165 family Cys-rich peptide [Methanomicrobiales archaeon]
MKAEELSQKCPECGCKDKKISRKNIKPTEDGFYIQHIPQGEVGIVKCAECGYEFELCKDSELPVKIKKKTL